MKHCCSTIQLCWNRFEQVKRFICPLHAQVQPYSAHTNTHIHRSQCERVLVTADNVFIWVFSSSFSFFMCFNYSVSPYKLSSLCDIIVGERNTKQNSIWSHYIYMRWLYGSLCRCVRRAHTTQCTQWERFTTNNNLGKNAARSVFFLSIFRTCHTS